MLKKLSFTYFFLTAVTAFFYSETFEFYEGVYLHGLFGVIGFVYNTYLSFMITESNFGNFYKKLDKYLVISSILLFIFILLKEKTAVLLMSFVYIGLSTAIFFRLKRNQENIRWYFLTASAVIGLLCWIFFAYSLNFDSFFGFDTKFSLNMLSFSFTMSLMILSWLVNDISMANMSFRIIMYLVVGGVLTMFLGMLMSYGPLEFAAASLLVCVIIFLLFTSLQKKNRYIAITFTGLLVTGVLGVWFINLVMSTGKGDRILLNLHSHIAFFGWTTLGMFYLLYRLVLIDGRKMFIAAFSVLLSLAAVSLYFIYDIYILMVISAVMFCIAGFQRLPLDKNQN